MSNNLTTNLNLLNPGNFRVTIDSREFANIEYFCTTAALPALTMNPIQNDFRNEFAYQPGEVIEYGNFEMEFMVDEDMKNYSEIFNWLLANKDDTTRKFRDILLSIRTNKSTINKEVRLFDCFPIGLGQLQFTTQDTNVAFITCSVTFQYNKFVITR